MKTFSLLSPLLLVAPLAAQSGADGTLGANSSSTAARGGIAPAPTVHYNGRATTVTLKAIDGKCVSPSGANWNDNRFRAYWNSSTGFVDGFVKFDLSSIPDGATVTALTLRAFHEFGFSNPFSNPEVVVYRSANDSWSRGPTDPHPGLNEALTPAITGFPVADLVPVDFNLDVTAANWSADLADDRLTLATRNVAGNVGRYSYVYFYSSDVSPAPPELTVEYSSGLTVSVTNAVAGQTATVTVTSATGAAGLAYSLVFGSTNYNVAGCTGTLSGFGPTFTVLGVVPTVGGNANVNVNVPAGATGVSAAVACLDLGGNCATDTTTVTVQ